MENKDALLELVKQKKISAAYAYHQLLKANKPQGHVFLSGLTSIIEKLVHKESLLPLKEIATEVNELCRAQGIPTPSRATLYRFVMRLQKSVAQSC